MAQTLSRRDRIRKETIEEILDIARDEMRAHGVAALTMSAIAERMGIQPPSLYNYFDGKEAIYDELFRRGFLAFRDWIEEHTASGGPLRDQLSSHLIAYQRFALQNPELYQLMFQRPVPGFEPSEESMAVSLGLLEEMRQELGTLLENDAFHTGIAVEAACDLIISMQYGITEMHLSNHPHLPIGEGRFGRLVEPAVDLFLNAWREK